MEKCLWLQYLLIRQWERNVRLCTVIMQDLPWEQSIPMHAVVWGNLAVK
jgi:hypothetical protein